MIRSYYKAKQEVAEKTIIIIIITIIIIIIIIIIIGFYGAFKEFSMCLQ